MQEIKKVVTNDFYKQNYIAVGNAIFTKNRALQYFSEYKEYILKLINKSDLALSNIYPVIYTPLPKEELLLKLVQQKREKIYKKLNLTTTKDESQKATQARTLFQYLVNNLTYDMTTKEEISNENSYEKFNVYLHTFKNKIKTLEQNYESYINAKDQISKNHYELLCKKQKQELQTLKQKLDEEETKTQNKQVLQSIYYALIKKRGICGEFSYAYSYLLQGLSIKNYILDIQFLEKNEPMIHSVNFLKFNSNKISHLIDVTLGVNLKQDKNKALIINKDDIKHIYPKLDILHIGEFDEFETNKKFVKNYYKDHELVKSIQRHISPIKGEECDKN